MPSRRLLAWVSVPLLAAAFVVLRGEGAEEGAGIHGYREIEWIDLLPDGDFEALMNPPAWVDEVEEGSAADMLDAADFMGDPESRRYFEALNSADVVERWVRKPIRIPGFIVPLEFDHRQRVTEFFLVPYFGACIHLPPPPPNQMIHVRYPEGLSLARLEDAFWVEGMLGASVTAHALGTSAYDLEGHRIRPWILEGP